MSRPLFHPTPGAPLSPLPGPQPQPGHTPAPAHPPQGQQQQQQPLPHAPAGVPISSASKVQSFAQSFGATRHEEKWKRQPHVNGTGATHVRSFHSRLTEDSLTLLDQQVNEWLDNHPQYEVKFVTSTVGDWTGKLKEPALIIQVWV